ncbi:zinc finger protein OZF-like [Physella acuta]|uniref:zinc finger protein OZF-like n=1 Tax=Physella acuta TaxID=109671 RepID=UPI0027DD258E|nr:zinc finger protein OZF-like [Physella acuta]XP_059166500.1 zinc finger protein OZF-like [Physella acuta]XP_059166501.1 zinc finger protein OZF-like [Physella acuta]XP_059166502.1 zinc finger protein OZF-like [Physella acuta]
MQNRLGKSAMSLQSALVVKQESNDQAMQFMDFKSDVTLAISTLEDVKPNLPLISTSNLINQNISSQSSPFEDKSNETVPFSTSDQQSDKTFYYSKDMKPNVSTEFLSFDVMKKDILTFSSFKGENENSLDVKRHLEYLPDSDAFIENFTILKSDLHHDLKELKELHKEVIDNFPTMYELSDKGLKTYKCDMCCQRFTHFHHITQHMKTHQQGAMNSHVKQLKKINKKFSLHKLHPEDRCNESFNSKYLLSQHKNIHAQIRPHECDVCHKKFTMKSNLSEHKNTHSNLKRYECDVCHKKFAHKSSLCTHKIIHSGHKPYECDVCHTNFAQKNSLIMHKNIHAGIKPHECVVCHKKFAYKSSLYTHKIIHSGHKPYECDVCHTNFAQKNSLIIHKNIHAGIKPHECNVCHKSFNSKNLLSQHKYIHTQIRPHECDVCHKKFTLKSHLSDHKNTHFNLKPYECDVCQKKFAHKSSLCTHKIIHSGHKPYECDVCHTNFAQKNSLIIHKNIHAGIKPHECDVS